MNKIIKTNVNQWRGKNKKPNSWETNHFKEMQNMHTGSNFITSNKQIPCKATNFINSSILATAIIDRAKDMMHVHTAVTYSHIAGLASSIYSFIIWFIHHAVFKRHLKLATESKNCLECLESSRHLMDTRKTAALKQALQASLFRPFSFVNLWYSL